MAESSRFTSPGAVTTVVVEEAGHWPRGDNPAALGCTSITTVACCGDCDINAAAVTGGD
jgi:hypothetical protein